MMAQEIFLIDSNSIIAPYHSYYPFDLASGFWAQLGQNIKEGRIVVLDIVQDEILKGNDDLTDWICSCREAEPLDHREQETIVVYAQILQHIQNNTLYKSTALQEWARSDVADPWLIAAAKNHGYTIVSFEEPNSNPDPRNPWKKAKIPDIARQFDVKTINLFSMMRALQFRL